MDHAADRDSRARFLVIGGFLGAGKTTALLRLARDLHARGKRVGLITNDQAAHLVDTGTLRVQGFRVEEVAGACFCCKFDELAECAEKLRAEERPDVLLGEPVGSCTDLAATVVQPLRKLYGDRYDVAPYSVLVDPARARQIVLQKGFGGFSSKVAYIFLKQLEEADVICLNKVDLLSPTEREEIVSALRNEFRNARVLAISGLTGEGFSAWMEIVAAGGPSGRNIVEVDYDVYAEGEAELGWLNATYDLSAGAPFDADAVARDVVARIAERLQSEGAETAHLKAMVETDAGTAVANFVGAGGDARLSQRSGAAASRGCLTVNARVHLDPARLRALAEEEVSASARGAGFAAAATDALHFRPGRPVPTHRYSRAEA